MAGWSHHEGLAVALPIANIDTDQLIPARFMSVPRDKGYDGYLLHDVRRDPDGALVPDFPLNRYGDASILVTARNFGSGSSREAAVYALVDAGIKVVIASSFGDIFASNAVNNGLLPALVSEADADRLLDRLASAPANAVVDLTKGRLAIDGIEMEFKLDEIWRQKLISGWDDIDLTRSHADAIAKFRARHASLAPWCFPVAG